MKYLLSTSLIFVLFSSTIHAQSSIMWSLSIGDFQTGLLFDQPINKRNSIGIQGDVILFSGLISNRIELYYKHYTKAFRDYPNANYYQIRLGKGTFRGFDNEWMVGDYSLGFFWGQHEDHLWISDLYFGLRLSTLYLPNNWYNNPFKHYDEWSRYFGCPVVVGFNIGRYCVKPKY
jgi:hypothetical protein